MLMIIMMATLPLHICFFQSFQNSSGWCNLSRSHPPNRALKFKTFSKAISEFSQPDFENKIIKSFHHCYQKDRISYKAQSIVTWSIPLVAPLGSCHLFSLQINVLAFKIRRGHIMISSPRERTSNCMVHLNHDYNNTYKISFLLIMQIYIE